MINADLLCMGCMARKGTAEVCYHCGYRDSGPESPLQLPPRTMLGTKYVIGCALGQGGFGITYLGFDLSSSNKLAVKEYFPVQISTRAQDHLTVNPISGKNKHDLEYGLAKFAEEGKALSYFKHHPDVVSMVDFLQANGTAYIVMAYVEGRDLTRGTADVIITDGFVGNVILKLMEGVTQGLFEQLISEVVANAPQVVDQLKPTMKKITKNGTKTMIPSISAARKRIQKPA